MFIVHVYIGPTRKNEDDSRGKTQVKLQTRACARKARRNCWKTMVRRPRRLEFATIDETAILEYQARFFRALSTLQYRGGGQPHDTPLLISRHYLVPFSAATSPDEEKKGHGPLRLVYVQYNVPITIISGAAPAGSSYTRRGRSQRRSRDLQGPHAAQQNEK